MLDEWRYHPLPLGTFLVEKESEENKDKDDEEISQMALQASFATTWQNPLDIAQWVSDWSSASSLFFD